MKRSSILIVALTLILGFATTSYANVYATNVEASATVITTGATNSTVDISFLLNEDADSGVDVKIYSGASLVRTITLATATKGSNSVSWDGTDAGGTTLSDGDYTFEVTAKDDGYTEWTKISDPLKTVMYSPKGVVINRNPDSPHFGTVYISNGYAGTSGNTGAFYNGDGIFIFSAAQDSLDFQTGGVDWTNSSESPGKTSIGLDDRVYVTDYGRDELWSFDANIDAVSSALIIDADNKETGDYVSGNWVTGSGADRAIYTANFNYGAYRGIVKYDLGLNDVLPTDDTGVEIIARPNGLYYQGDVEVDAAGNIYFTQYRALADQAYPLLKYPPYTGTQLTLADTLWTVPKSEFYAKGLALDEARNRVVWASEITGDLVIHNATTGAIMDTLVTGQSRNKDVAFDAVGNMYTIDNGTEYWNVWSAPDGANSFTTPGRATIAIETPQVFSVVINEIGEPYNMTGTYNDSYVELYNTTDAAIDVGGWTLWSNEITLRSTKSFVFPAGTSIAAGGYLIATRDKTSFLADYGTYVDAGIVPDPFPTTGSVYIGDDYAFELLDGGGTQVDITTSAVPWNSSVFEKNAPTDDGTVADNWHPTSQSAPVQGTPGAENSVAPVETAYTIVEIQTPDTGGDVSQHNGELVETSGVITGLTSYSLYMQAGTADYSGIYVYVDGSVSAYALGDDVTVNGTVGEYNNLTQIQSITNITVNSSGNDLPAPIVLITNTLAEGHEGMLVTVSGACTAVSTNAGTDRWAFKLDDGSGDALIDDQVFSDAETSATVGSIYDVVGVVNYYYGAFTVNPRDLADIEEVIIENDLNLTFEDDTDVANWGNHDEASTSTLVAYDAGFGVDGSGAIRISDGGWGLMAKRPVQATAGSPYALTLSVKAGIYPYPVPLELSVQGLSTTDPIVDVSTAGEYTQFMLTGVADAGTSGYIRIAAASGGGADSTWVDNLIWDDNYVPVEHDETVTFEDDGDIASWGVHDETSKSTVAAFVAGEGVDGSGALRISDAGWGLRIKRPIEASAGATYELSIMVKAGAYPYTAPLELSVQGLSTVDPVVDISTATDWTEFVLSGVADAGTMGYVRFAAESGSGADSTWIDNLVWDDAAVIVDEDPPTLLTAGALSSTIVELVFNEDIDPVTGANVANYMLDHSIGAPTAAVVLEDMVTLTLGTGMMFDSTYTVIINNVADESGNVLLADTASFMYSYEFVSDLFFSEYVEGSSSNKALEIYNPTDAAIDLSGYTIGGTNNDATDWQYYYTFPDSALSIEALSTYLIVDASAVQEVQDMADWLTGYPGPTSYNGNDARGLMKIVGIDTILIDALGDYNNPDELYYSVAGVADGMKEHTLVRKADLTMGNPDWMMSSGVDAESSEWVMFPQNTYRFLGVHPHTDLAGPELAGIVAVSTTQLQLRFNEPVVSADALVLTNFSVSDGIGNPTAVTAVNELVYLLDIAEITPNLPYTLTVNGIHDLIDNEIMAGSTIDVVLDIPGDLPIDRTMNDFVDGIGHWGHPTYSGSTTGLLTTSTFASSDSMAFAGTHSGEMVLLDDPGVDGGWFVRLWNINRVDRIDADSKMFFYLYGGSADMQARIVVKDDDGYEAGPWQDISFDETDWQVVSVDLENDVITGWINGNNTINAAGGSVAIDCIQIRCSEDVSTNLYLDMVTERYNIDPVEVTFDVQMSVQTLMETFVPGTDFLDIAGSINEWGTYAMVLEDPEADSLYTITVTDVYPGETLEYKFRINGNWDTSEFPGGGANRTYVVPDTNSVVFHWYDDVDTYVGVAGLAIPTEYALHDNYPNPFNPITNIKYDIPENTQVRISVYNTIGQHVIDLVNEEQAAGFYHLQWNGLNKQGRPVSSGLYIYRLTTPEFNQTEKMTYLK